VKNYANDILQKPMMEIAIQDIARGLIQLTLYPLEKESKYIVGKINEEVVLLIPWHYMRFLGRERILLKKTNAIV